MRLKLSNRYHFIITAEHASDAIPASCAELLTEFVAGCETHQIYDPGAKAIAQKLAAKLKAPLLLAECSPLVIDLNRSVGSESQFSPPIAKADESLREELIQTYYMPFRNSAKEQISQSFDAGETVVHLSVQSFTKSLAGQHREVDIGILYDDKRPRERRYANSLITLLKGLLPDLCIRANEPYQGREDGHTTALRRRYPEDKYIGIELIFSQNLKIDAAAYAKMLATALQEISS